MVDAKTIALLREKPIDLDDQNQQILPLKLKDNEEEETNLIRTDSDFN